MEHGRTPGDSVATDSSKVKGSEQPILTPEGWTLLTAFSAELSVSRIWLRDRDGQREFMADIDRSGFDGWFEEEEDWEMYPRYQAGPPRSSLQEALCDAEEAWVLAMPCAPVHADYGEFFSVGIVEAAKTEDTFTQAWLRACEAGRQ